MRWIRDGRMRGSGHELLVSRRPGAPRVQGKQTARAGGDRGAAMSLLLIGMALSLVFVTFLMYRIGHANSLRTTAEQGADAAAIAGAAEIRDRGAAAIVSGVLPYGIIYEPGSETRAKEYAGKNDTVADSVRPSGLLGYTVKADVHTQECQTKIKDVDKDYPTSRIRCRSDEEKDGFQGKATAIAQVTFPMSCTIQVRGTFDPRGSGPDNQPTFPTQVVCNGQVITSLRQARRLFTVRLVDKEDPEKFNPDIFNGGPSGPIPPGGVANQANRELGKRLAAQRGWTGAQWECLDQLWQHESGWDHTAENPSSGAYGIPQSLPASKMATHGADYRTNPATQIRWGMDYIAARPDYGTPCRAWALWQSRSPHWY